MKYDDATSYMESDNHNSDKSAWAISVRIDRITHNYHIMMIMEAAKHEYRFAVDYRVSGKVLDGMLQ